jgi:hypothetical protein
MIDFNNYVAHYYNSPEKVSIQATNICDAMTQGHAARPELDLSHCIVAIRDNSVQSFKDYAAKYGIS